MNLCVVKLPPLSCLTASQMTLLVFANTTKIVIIHQGHFVDDIEFYYDRCNKLELAWFMFIESI